MVERALRNAVPILNDRLYYVALTTNPNMAAVGQRHFFSIDNDMIYWNFYLDFGPLNLGHVYRFCILMNHKLKDPKLADKIIYFYSAEHPHKRTNAVFLICAWLMMCKGKLPEEAFAPFKGYYLPFPPWHDATPTVCHFNLTILDTLRGMHKAREHKFFDFHTFNVEEYEHYEQVENGDLNWCMEGRFLAFAGPHAERQCSPGGYYNLRPEDYISYFKRKNVTLVVRLNKPYYDAKKFTSQGIDHMELYFIDGSNPPDPILNKFITRMEETQGAIAVHCKAGLGRTGTCIGCYMMKHFRITAEETIGWLRIVRPGSIIGPQQQYMKEMQMRMWREGDLHRARLYQLGTFEVHGGAPAGINGGMIWQQFLASQGEGGLTKPGSTKGSERLTTLNSHNAESERDDVVAVNAASNGASNGHAVQAPGSHSKPAHAHVHFPSTVSGRSGSSATSTPTAQAPTSSNPSTPNSLSRRLGNLSLSGSSPPRVLSASSQSAASTPVTSSASAASAMSTAAAVNANSARAEHEGRETQGDLLRMRRAQAASTYNSPASAPLSPMANHHTTAVGTPTSGSRLTALSTGRSPAAVGLRPDSRSGASSLSPKNDLTNSGSKPPASGRTSIGSYLGFSK